MFRSSLVLGSFLTSSACLAGPTQPSQANISVTVPEICSIDARSLLIDKEKGVVSGEVLEMCNSNRAFRLIASHRMLQPGEQGRIDYAGESSNLDAEGISDVVASNRLHPVSQQRAEQPHTSLRHPAEMGLT